MITGSTPISGLPTGTAVWGNDIIPYTHGITGSATPATTYQGSVLLFRANMMPGFISEYGGQLTYITGTSYRVEAGQASVNGVLLGWSSAITRSGLTFTSGTMNYVYLYLSAGVAAVEESTTAPVWDSDLNYYKKTGDSSRRCIGFLQASTVNTIRMFVTSVRGRVAEFYYVDGDVSSGVKAPVNANNGFATGTAWGAVDLSNSIPAHATEVLLIPKEVYAGATDEAVIGVTPWNQGTGVAASQVPFQVRGRTNTATSNQFPGNTWMAVVDPVKVYYKILTISGNPRTQIEVHGARIIR